MSAGQSLTWDLVEAIGQAIVSDGFGVGAFPTEAALCERFNASRNVVREAVKMLTAKGLLSARPRVGTSVQPHDRWNLLDPDVLRWLMQRTGALDLLIAFSEMRLAFEPEAAAFAAQRADAKDLEAIVVAIERMRAAARGADDALDADTAFHEAVLVASKNPFFIQLRELVHTSLKIPMRRTFLVKAPSLSLPDHERVADAILAGDAVAARDGMRAMMLEVLDLLKSLPGSQTPFFDAPSTGPKVSTFALPRRGVEGAA